MHAQPVAAFEILLPKGVLKDWVPGCGWPGLVKPAAERTLAARKVCQLGYAVGPCLAPPAKSDLPVCMWHCFSALRDALGSVPACCEMVCGLVRRWWYVGAVNALVRGCWCVGAVNAML